MWSFPPQSGRETLYTNYYRPLVSKDGAGISLVLELVDRLFAGRPAELVNHLLDSDQVANHLQLFAYLSYPFNDEHHWGRIVGLASQAISAASASEGPSSNGFTPDDLAATFFQSTGSDRRFRAFLPKSYQDCGTRTS